MEVSEESKEVIEAFFPIDSMYGLYEFNAPANANCLNIRHLSYKEGKLQNEENLVEIDLKGKKEFLKGTISLFQAEKNSYNVVCTTGEQSVTVNSIKFQEGTDEMISTQGSVLKQQEITIGEKFVLYIHYVTSEEDETGFADASKLKNLDRIYNMDIVEVSFS